MSDVRYPIGPWSRDAAFTPEKRRDWTRQIADLPKNLHAAVDGLSDEQLDTPYRPGGWTVRQTVHHIADSHLNAYVRFRLTLTEDEPTIRPYDQDSWAQLSDSVRAPVTPSLRMVDGLHDRWCALLESLSDADFGRRLRHPEAGVLTLTELLSLYSWHGRHHVAHITGLRREHGW
jgi:uncharacterized damage-inducible protein DinB